MEPALDVRLALTVVTKARVSTRVAQQLQRLIEQGTLVVGQKLPSERELVGLLGVSRPAVREALRLLEIMGFLRTDAGRGTFVCASIPSPRPAAVRDRLDLFEDPYLWEQLAMARETVEPRVAALAAASATDDEIKGLRRLHAEVGQHILAADLAAFTRADLALHNAIADSARNRIFRLFLDSIQQLLLEMRQLSMADLRAPRARETQREHLAIINAIATHNAERAERAMLDHFSDQRRAYESRLSFSRPGQPDAKRR